MVGKHGAIEQQLNNLGWVINRPGLHGQIISAILVFQRKWHGTSPSNAHIAHAVGLSPGQVCYELKQMEQKGLIKDDKGWPRTLEVIPPKAVMKKEEEPVTDTVKRKKREQFVVVAKKFAQALTDYVDQYGRQPYLKDLAPTLGYKAAPALGRIAQQMVEYGWLHHKWGHQHDYALTALGRAMLFGEVREDVHTDMPVHARRDTPVHTGGVGRVQKAHPPVWQSEPRVEIRRALEPAPMYVPPQRMHEPVVEPPTFTGNQNLAGIETVDLVLELQSRGFRVMR